MLVEGVARRYKLDGQELDQAGVTYVLHKADSGPKGLQIACVTQSVTRA